MKNQSSHIDSRITFNNSSYPEFFRRDAHFLLAVGYRDARAKLTSETGELDITIEIARAIRKKLCSFDLPEEIYNRYYSVMAEDPLEEPGGSTPGDERIYLDIVIEEARGRPRSRYIFEAKRLRKNGFAIGKYCGDEGLLRFITSKYAKDYPEAAMIGCIQSDNERYWLKELKRKFEQDKSKTFCIQEHLKPHLVIPELPNEWVSVHYRSSTGGFTLFHIFLDCSSLS